MTEATTEPRDPSKPLSPLNLPSGVIPPQEGDVVTVKHRGRKRTVEISYKNPASMMAVMTNMTENLRKTQGKKVLGRFVSRTATTKRTHFVLEGGNRFEIVERGLTQWMEGLRRQFVRGELSEEAYFDLLLHQYRLHRRRNGGVGVAQAVKVFRLAVLERFGFLCANCEKSIHEGTSHIDHHKPKSKGFPLTTDNAVALCPRCNIRKHAKDPSVFYSPEKLAKIEAVLHATRQQI